MAYYRHHVFFCTNQRQDGRACCQNHQAAEMRLYVKDRTRELGLADRGGVRINTAGCLARCDEGPVVVVYPQGVWYRYENKQDLDEIIDEHLMKGKVVDRLAL